MTEGQPPVPIQPLPVFSPPPPPPSITPAPTFESHGIEGDRRHCHGCKAEIFWGVEHVCPVLMALQEKLANAQLKVEPLRNALETIRFGMQMRFGLEHLKRATEDVKDAGAIRELGAWTWYVANATLQLTEKPKSDGFTKMLEDAEKKDGA